jgi:hypothetical protein
MSSEVSSTTMMMRSMSSTMRIVCNLGLLAFEFFHDEGFNGETFIFLDVSASSRGFFGGVTFLVPIFLFPFVFLFVYFISSSPFR